MDVIPVTLNALLPPASESIICSDLSVQQVALIQIQKSFLKKFVPRGKSKAADKAALDLFIESNDRCSKWEPNEDSYHAATMQRARLLLHNRFFSGQLQAPRWSLAKALDKLTPGPGSSQGTKLTDFVGKLFHSKLTTYDRRLWKYYCDSMPKTWQAAEIQRAMRFGCYEVVKHSKLTFAKKNHDISRVINTEANLDMLFQLGLGSCIEACLQDWFNINLSTQPTMNRFLAKLGSVYGSHATIDLKSASDLNSKRFMEWFLHPQMIKPLDTVRAKCIELPNGTVMDLETYSTMGNGFTFPLETLVFSCIVEAAYEELGIPTDNSGAIPAFSVFGDDIICTKKAYDKVCDLLEWCGFTVNREKSFNTGSFRESCGADFFKGHDVRGVYLKKLFHETHYYSIFNRLSRWSLRMHIDIAPLLRRIKGLVDFRPVPFDSQDIAGIKCTLSVAGYGLSPRGTKYHYFAVVPRRRSTRDYEANPSSLLLGAIGGYLNGSICCQAAATGVSKFDSLYKPNNGSVGSYTLRDKPDGEPRVKLRSSRTTSWDWIPQKGLTTLDYDLLFKAISLEE